MSDPVSQPPVSAERQALAALRKMRARLEEFERAATEPIAVVGLACRFPAAPDAEAFWRVLRDGVDAIGLVPSDRWNVDAFYDPDPDAPGKVISKYGGYLETVDRFDPEFFGIAPREAVSIDPQHRLLLEVAWEALENAALAPQQLASGKTGVYVGISVQDYWQLQSKYCSPEVLNAYFGIGNALCAASGRLSYLLGLQGPAVSIDTACSSSLVAVHLACHGLRTGDCTTAIVGGVNLLLLPEVTIALSRARMLSPDGRCKTFDAAADGYARGEGCGVVVLKKLSAARADGDRILAVIRGTAVNQDGRSGGFTAPNEVAQRTLIREALERAGVSAADVDYVEAHGTGTSLGDPIEIQALAAALRDGRDQSRPLLVGSVKTNIGHLESAAGIAGLIKVILSMQHGEIPPHLHFHTVNPHIDAGDFAWSVPTRRLPWAPRDGRRLAGVSSFGFTGTNAHVIVEQTAEPAAERQPGQDRPLQILALSAKSQNALKALAARFADHLDASPSAPLADSCFSANTGRAHFGHRCAVVGETAGEIQQQLAAWAAGRPAASLHSAATDVTSAPEVVFLFTGQGAQHAGMGRELYETQPVFRDALNRCDALLKPYLDRPLISVLYSEDDDTGLLDDTAYSQPALFALEYALVELWRSWGVEPAALMGHSLGEDVAACIAGVFSLEDGLRMVTDRGRLMRGLPDTGLMAAVFAGEGRVRAAIEPFGDDISIAGVNAPDNIVISGVKPAVEAAIAALERDAVKVRRLRSSRACHSRLMDPILDEVERLAARMTVRAPDVTFVSTVTGTVASGEQLGSPVHWRRHLRDTVRFQTAVETLYRSGHRLFVEIGPGSTAIGMGRRCIAGDDAVWLPSLGGRHDTGTILNALAALYVAGVKVNWSGFDAPFRRSRVALPTYPFERQRCWVEPLAAPTPHPLIGTRLESPAIRDTVFEVRLSRRSAPLLGEHRVQGQLVVSAAVLITMALQAARAAGRDDLRSVANLRLLQPLIVPDAGERLVQIILAAEGGSMSVQVVAQSGGAGAASDWTVHATGRLEPRTRAPIDRFERLTRLRTQGIEETPEALHERALQSGVENRAILRAMRGIRRGRGEAIAKVCLPRELSSAGYSLHPVMLDACFGVLGAALPEHVAQRTYLLAGIERFTVFEDAPETMWISVSYRPRSASDSAALVADVEILDDEGKVVAAVEGLKLALAAGVGADSVGGEDTDWLHELAWHPKPLVESSAALLRNPEEIVGAVEPGFRALAAEHRLDRADEWLDRLDALSTTYAVNALHALGWRPRTSEHLTLDGLTATLGIAVRHKRLLASILGMLEQDGVLARTGDGWEVRRELEPADPDLELAELRVRYPEAAAEIGLTSRCGAELSRVLRAEVDPLDILFSRGSFDAVEPLYRDSVAARVFNGLMQRVVAAAAEGTGQRTLRILEVGAGTGSTTASILPVLAPDRTAYLFTDVSAGFTVRAAERFRDYSFVEYQPLDLERSFDVQGLGGRQFDLVLATNVLHATRDLRQTLARLRDVLAPGGLLAFIESSSARRWLDITFGLTDGWWRFEDHDLRRHPLLTAPEWRSALIAAGFGAVRALPLEADRGLPTFQSLMIAQNPATVRPAQDAAAPPKRWVVLADHGGVGEELAARLRGTGDRVDLVFAEPGRAQKIEGAAHVDPSDASAFDRMFGGEASGESSLAGVVHLWSLDAQRIDDTSVEALDADQIRGSGAVLQIVQALLKRSAMAPIWIVTRRAQAVPLADADDPAAGAAQAAVWGLGRVVALEHPQLWGGLVDLDAEDPARAVSDVLREIQDADGEDQVARRRGQRYVARLVPAQRIDSKATAIRADASYLITGGVGGLGLKVARWLASQGARNLVLTTRRAWDAEHAQSEAPDSEISRQQQAVRAIEKTGARVHVVTADVGDLAQMSNLFARFGDTLPPLGGVVHAAAASGSRLLREMTAGELMTVLRAKVRGTWVLDRLTAPLPLDFFVLFSSTTGLLGSAGLGHYAAANVFLDSFAHQRRARGLPVVSINWGAWDQMRMETESQQRVFAQGLRPMASERALAILGQLLGGSAVQPIVVSADWPTLKSVYEAKRVRPLLREIGPRQAPIAPQAPAGRGLVRQLADAASEDRAEILTAFVRGEASRVLGLDREQIDLRRGLFEMGMDSLMSVDLKSRLEAATGLKLPTTLTFNYPTVSALVEYLQRELGSKAPPLAAPEPIAESVPIAPVSAATNGAAPPQLPIADRDDDLSEDELAALLAEKLAQI